MATKTELRDLLPPETIASFNETIEIKLGNTAPKTWLVTKGPFKLLQLLFPGRKLQPRNTEYPAIPTWDHFGNRVDVSLRRALKDLEWRGRGIALAKGFTVEPRNGDNFDLRSDNLRAIPVSKKPRKNSWIAHYLIGIRLEALLAGRCPDEAMAELIARNLEEAAANDNNAEDNAGDVA